MLQTVPSRKGALSASLAVRFPVLARQWATDKNRSVSPVDVHAGSPHKAWWVCVEGHTWQAVVRDRVRKQTGCPFCSGKKACEMNCVGNSPRAVALWHPTKNLPATPNTVTSGSGRKFWWVCERDHLWLAPPNNVVRQGTGCPRCRDSADSKRERTCRTVLEALTGHPFPKMKPEWLLSSRGFQMELDGYAPNLGVAFEHHGVQHYQFTHFFHRTLSKFERVVQVDAEKRALCLNREVHLIEVRWDCEDVQGHFRDHLRPLGLLREV